MTVVCVCVCVCEQCLKICYTQIKREMTERKVERETDGDILAR